MLPSGPEGSSTTLEVVHRHEKLARHMAWNLGLWHRFLERVSEALGTITVAVTPLGLCLCFKLHSQLGWTVEDKRVGVNILGSSELIKSDV